MSSYFVVGTETFASKLAKLNVNDSNDDRSKKSRTWTAGVGVRSDGGGTTSAPPADGKVKRTELNKQPMHAPFKTSMQYGAMGKNASLKIQSTPPQASTVDLPATLPKSVDSAQARDSSTDPTADSALRTSKIVTVPVTMSWAEMMGGAAGKDRDSVTQQKSSPVAPTPSTNSVHNDDPMKTSSDDLRQERPSVPPEIRRESNESQKAVPLAADGQFTTSSSSLGMPAHASENGKRVNNKSAGNGGSKQTAHSTGKGYKQNGKGQKSKVLCTRWLRGDCKYGPECLYRHGDPNTEEKRKEHSQQANERTPNDDGANNANNPGNLSNHGYKSGKKSKYQFGNDGSNVSGGKGKTGKKSYGLNSQNAASAGVFGPGNGRVPKGGRGSGMMGGGRGSHMQSHYNHSGSQAPFHKDQFSQQYMYAMQQHQRMYGNGSYMQYGGGYGSQWQQQMAYGGVVGPPFMANGGNPTMGSSHTITGNFSNGASMNRAQQHFNSQKQQRHMQQLSMQQGATANVAQPNGAGIYYGSNDGSMDRATEDSRLSSSSSSSSSSSPSSTQSQTENVADSTSLPESSSVASTSSSPSQPLPPPPPLPPPSQPPPPSVGRDGLNSGSKNGQPYFMSVSPNAIAKALGPSPPPPLIVPDLDNSLVFSIDVECVATGLQHHDRSVAQIGMVNYWGVSVLNLIVKPEKPVVSYITPLTGLTKDQVEQYGMPEDQALQVLKQNLPKNAVLVGMNIRKDIEWLQLVEGNDFQSCYDLAGLFRVWNQSVRNGKGGWTYFGLDHCAQTWLNINRGIDLSTGRAGGHDAVRDAYDSMALFNAYRSVQFDEQQLQLLQFRTLTTPIKPSFAKQNPTYEGCCMGNRKSCICGAPFFS